MPSPEKQKNKDRQIPRKLVLGIIGFCVLPLFLSLFNIQFATYSSPLPVGIQSDLQSPEVAEILQYSLRQSLTHSMMEQAAFFSVVLIALFTLIHFRVTQSRVIPVIGLALIFGGMLDSFHGVIADCLLKPTFETADIIGLSWVVCRSFDALILIIATGMLVARRRRNQVKDIILISAVAVVFAVASFLIVRICMVNGVLPKTIYRENPVMGLIVRPLDLIPLLLFAFAGIKLFPRLNRRRPSVFTHALVISAVPNVIAHAHMAFGSDALFDNHFNIAHFVRILAHVVILIGLVIDYFKVYKYGQDALTDVSKTQEKLRKANYDLIVARDQALEANRHKNIFLANMSHELRTPLNSVIGFSDVLLNNKANNLSETDLKYLTRISENGRHLLRLINTILDLSKIESGQHKLELDDESLDELIDEVLIQFEVLVREKGITLEKSVSSEMNPINTDRFKLKQVLINLVGNAIKFTDQGGVSLNVDVDAATKTVNRIDIVDSGIGIPSDKTTTIFDAFQQADTSTSRKYAGTGLGLSISKSLCNLMGYRLEVTSKEGEGSTFTLYMND